MTVILSDESVNRYGYRVITRGINLAAFKKNPILLYMHIRADEKNPKTVTIGKVVNLRVDGEQLLGELVFDLKDEFAKEIARKFEEGFLNAVSISIDPIEITEEATYMLPGQILPTVTKCELTELSVVDIPGNKNACRLSLSGKSIEPDELKLIFNKPQPSMKKIIATLAAYSALSLSDTATEDEVVVGIKKFFGETLTGKDAEITQLKTEKANLELKLKEGETNALKGKAEAMIDGALAAKKIVAGEKASFLKLASGSEDGYTTVKALLDSKKGFDGITNNLKGDTDGGDGQNSDSEKDKAEWEKLHKASKVSELKASDPDKYNRLYKAKYGKEPVS